MTGENKGFRLKRRVLSKKWYYFYSISYLYHIFISYQSNHLCSGAIVRAEDISVYDLNRSCRLSLGESLPVSQGITKRSLLRPSLLLSFTSIHAGQYLINTKTKLMKRWSRVAPSSITYSKLSQVKSSQVKSSQGMVRWSEYMRYSTNLNISMILILL